MIKAIVAAPLLFAATQSFALYCGSDSNQNHINAGRATLKYSLLAYANGSNAYLGMTGDSTMIKETTDGYYEITTSCSGGDTPPSVPVGPDKVSDGNPSNQLDQLAEFSGKNYNVVVVGSDLVKDTGNDEQADSLDLPRTVYVDIPENATIEAAWVSYYGSGYLTTDGGQDNTTDTVNGGEAGIDTEEDIRSNEINITIGNNDLGALTPASTLVGPQSRSKISWWKMQSPYGTLAHSRVALYNNRLDLTSEFIGQSGSIPVTVTRLQRADFAGKADSSRSYDKPKGPNDNNEYANDCLGNASYSVMVVYSLPTGQDKTITVLDGMSWAWNNDFATSKATNPVPSRLALDINLQHEAVDATEDVNVYLGAIDGDTYGHNGVEQCESSSFAHETGNDHTWVRSGSSQENYYANIYEGKSAPEIGDAFPSYPAVTTIAKGLNFNIVKIGVENVQDEATNTLIHVEGDSMVSTQIPQEAMLIAFAVLEAKTKAQSEPPTVEENTVPTVTLIGDAEMTLEFGATFTDPGATATDTEDGAITPVADCNVSTSVAATYTCTYTATDSGDLSDTKTRTVIVKEEIVEPEPEPEPTCADYTSSYADHEAAGRVEIKYLSSYYVKGSSEYLGSTYIGGSATLIETAPGQFAKGSCN